MMLSAAQSGGNGALKADTFRQSWRALPAVQQREGERPASGATCIDPGGASCMVAYRPGRARPKASDAPLAMESAQLQAKPMRR